MSVLSTLATHEYYRELANSLPPPVIEKPEHRERRLSTAIEAFQALKPGDAYEGRLAVQIVLCGAHAAECQCEAGVYREDFAKRTRCRAQANSMLREERAAKRTLAQEQKLRLATEAVTGTEWARPSTAAAPPPAADIRTAPPLRPHVEAAEAAPQPGPERPVVVQVRPAAAQIGSQPVAAVSAPPPSAEAIEQAEAFMAEEIVAAAQIRHDRGLTPWSRACFHEVTFPTDPAVIDALVRGMSDHLVVLDEIGGEDLEEAA
jgi:hypothetical protein